MGSLAPISSALETIENAALHITILPYHIYRYAKSKYNNPESRWRRKRRAELIPPKVVQRGRPLTPPLQPKTLNTRGGSLGKKAEQAYDEQASSYLFSKLPAEVRTLIYQEVILANAHRGNDVNIGWGKRPNARIGPNATPTDVLTELTSLNHIKVLNLLCTCRRIYSEMIDLVYSTPTFHFVDYHAFLALRMIILPHRWDKVRHLDMQLLAPSISGWPGGNGLHHHLSYEPIQHLTARFPLSKYEPPGPVPLATVLEILAASTGLQSLTIEFGKPNISLICEAELLDKLKDMAEQREKAGLKLKKENFTVVLGWAFEPGTWNESSSERDDVHDWPFVLLRPTCARI